MAVNAAHIGVTAKDGVIALMGHVDTYTEKYAAEMAARRVKSFKAVAEEVEVRLPSGIKFGDEEIAAAAVSRLKWNVAVPANAVKVTVEKGWVTLTAEVEWHYQLTAAAEDIRSLFGVVGVSNRIDHQVNSERGEYKRHITRALHRSYLDPKCLGDAGRDLGRERHPSELTKRSVARPGNRAGDDAECPWPSVRHRGVGRTRVCMLGGPYRKLGYGARS